MDSGGKEERSRGSDFTAGLGFAATLGFGSGSFFFAAGFAAFRGLVAEVERAADFLAGLDAGIDLAFAIGTPLSRFTRDLEPVGRRLQ